MILWFSFMSEELLVNLKRGGKDSYTCSNTVLLVTLNLLNICFKPIRRICECYDGIVWQILKLNTSLDRCITETVTVLRLLYWVRVSGWKQRLFNFTQKLCVLCVVVKLSLSKIIICPVKLCCESFYLSRQ